MEVAQTQEARVGRIPRRTTDGPAPISASQRQIWLHEQFAGAPIYNEVIAIERTGAFAASIVERTLEEIVRRHDAWRTSVSIADRAPMLVPHPPFRVEVPVVDLRVLAAPEREAECERLAEASLRRPFDLSAPPLFRPVVVRLEDERWRCYLSLHHLIFDGVSANAVFLPEFAAIYNAYSAGLPSPLPEPSLQYLDYCEWQQTAPVSEDLLRSQLDYWRNRLADLPPMDLPTDARRPTHPQLATIRHTLELPRDVTDALRLLGRHRNVTPYMTLMAALLVLLHRYQGHDDVIIGSVASARKHTELEGVLGCFVNAVALRTELSGNPSFLELLRRVRNTVLDALSNSDVTFERIVAEVAPPRQAGVYPFFQVFFTLEQEPVLPAGWTPLAIQPSPAKSDLWVRYVERTRGLEIGLVADSDVFSTDTTRRMAGHLRTLLEAVARNPDTRLSELPLLTAEERRTLLVDWNRTDTDYARHASIHELFEGQAARAPSSTALSLLGANVTYGELDERADAFAERLRRGGVGRGSLVGVCLPRSVEMIVALIGVLKAGAGYVALDPEYPDKRLQFMLADANLRLVVAEPHMSRRFASMGASSVVLDRFQSPTSAAESTRVSPEDVAYVAYTSGSTGRPKGVLVPHRGVVRLVNKPNYVTLTPDDVVLQFAPLPFDASTFEIWGALLNGARLAIFPPGTPSLDELGKVIVDEGVTTLWLTAPLFHQMVDLNPDALGGVRQVLAGGDVLSPDHVRRLLRRNSGTIINGYGPTENTTFTCCHRMNRPNEVPSSSVPIGRPISNTNVYALDRYRQPVPIGVPGELYVGGDGLGLGYLNRPELTSERFVGNPFSDQADARLYKTGDRVRYRPDGALEFLGRFDNQLKIRGFRIEPGEVEAALMSSPAVAEAAVVAAEGPAGSKRLEAYVVPVAGQQPTVGELRRHLGSTLPDYMVPARFVLLDRLPRTASGKLDRLAAVRGRPAAVESAPWRPVVGHHAALAEIWQRALGIPVARPDDNFFDLGGDSLQAVQLFADIRSRFGRSLPLSTLFEAPTFAQLSAVLSNPEGPRAASPLVTLQAGGDRPPFFCVHAIGGEVVGYMPLARRLGANQPVYALSAVPEESGHEATIEEMAHRYIEAVKEVRPEGPYLLGGYSFGGILAYELARQLTARGDRVNLVALIDAVPPAIQKVQPSPRRLVVSALRRLPAWLREGHFAHKARCWSWAIGRRLTGRSVSMDTQPDKLLLDWLPAAYIPLARRLRRAVRNYTPGGYPGRLTLFRAASVPVLLPEDPEVSWRRLAEDGVETHLLHTSHMTMLQEPAVGELASALRDCLARAADGTHDEQRRQVHRERAS